MHALSALVWTNAFFRRMEEIGVVWHQIYGKEQEKMVLGRERQTAEGIRQKIKVICAQCFVE